MGTKVTDDPGIVRCEECNEDYGSHLKECPYCKEKNGNT